MSLTVDKLIAELQNLRARHPEAGKAEVRADECTFDEEVQFEDGFVELYYD